MSDTPLLPIRGFHLRSWLISLVMAVSLMLGAATAYAQPQSDAQTQLNGKVDLARLVDLCAQRLELNVEYDETALRGTVTLRLGGSITDQELWTLTNRVLAVRGFTLIRLPVPTGEDKQKGLLSVVKLADALNITAIQLDTEAITTSGYGSLVVRLKHQPAKKIIDAIKPILSRQGSLITGLGTEGLILLADLSPRLTEALRLIELLDTAQDPPKIEILPAQFIGASQLASLVTSAVQTRDKFTAQPLLGQVTPTPNDRDLILIAPLETVGEWKAMIARFDVREAVVMRTYSPLYFGTNEVSRLIEQTVKDTGPRGSGDLWRLVTDELTGTIIVTAMPQEHEQIAKLLARLAATPPEARRPLRSYVIRNRNVLDILYVLSALVDAGALESAAPGNALTPGNTLTPGFSGISGNTSAPFPTRQSDTERQLFQNDPLGGTVQESRGPGSSESERRTDEFDYEPRQSLRRDHDGLLPVSLTADEGTNTLIAIGEPRHLDQIERIIRQLDVRQSQVMIEVLVASLTDGDTFDLGVELEKLEISGDTLIRLSSLFGLGGAGLVSGGIPPGAGLLPGVGSGFSGVALNPGDFSIVIRALETLNEGQSLSMSKVLVNNNQQATLDSVLQQPFLSTNASNTVATTSFGGTEDAGTTVTVTPQIAEGDHLVLEYSVSLSTFVGESSDPALPPPRQQTALQSVVTIPDGYTIVVGGLEVTSDAEAESKVPLLGSLPVIGELFKSRSKSRSRSRFYLFIRASVMRHDGFEDLKYLSDMDTVAAGIDDGWPEVKPRIIR